jgi:two-component system response regulator AtoC
MEFSRSSAYPPFYLQSRNPAFQRILVTLKRVARYPCTVLIEGETGVGKEVIASYLHDESPRAAMPYVKVNCGAIPESLVESELFGYEGGAFTGAKKEGSAGLFEKADKGTILLDEVGELPPLMQVKLLRALQEREIRRVGGTWSKTVDVRVIASTNKDLKRLVDEGRFREDLYYRLQIVHVKIPPLRERKEDLPVFVEMFLTMFADLYGSPRKTLSREVMAWFADYHWPGNIRQLRNCLESLYATVEEAYITMRELPASLLTSAREAVPGNSLRSRLQAYEKQLIQEALDQAKSVRQAAGILEIPHSTLLRRMEKLGIKMVDQHADA